MGLVQPRHDMAFSRRLDRETLAPPIEVEQETVVIDLVRRAAVAVVHHRALRRILPRGPDPCDNLKP
jgi:hypothetical protein